LLAAIDAYDGWPTLRYALQFAALTFARPGEIRGRHMAEIDMHEAVWRHRRRPQQGSPAA
jgi:integrase